MTISQGDPNPVPPEPAYVREVVDYVAFGTGRPLSGVVIGLSFLRQRLTSWQKFVLLVSLAVAVGLLVYDNPGVFHLRAEILRGVRVRAGGAFGFAALVLILGCLKYIRTPKK